jgi:hypothetical protein
LEPLSTGPKVIIVNNVSVFPEILKFRIQQTLNLDTFLEVLPNIEQFNFYFTSAAQLFKKDYIKYSTFQDYEAMVCSYNGFLFRVKELSKRYGVPELQYIQLIKRDEELDYALSRIRESIELERII